MTTRPASGRVQGYPGTDYPPSEDPDDYPISRAAATSFAEIAAARLSRRGVLSGAAGLAGLAAAPALARQAGSDISTLTFDDVDQTITATDRVAKGYRRQVLIRWGDKVLADAPVFDPAHQTPEAQAAQFGHNNDFLAFLPLPRGAQESGHGLLWANHEATSSHLMFPSAELAARTERHARVEMAAHGGSIVEVKRAEDGTWSVLPGGAYARRITPETPMTISGPAAGHERLKTSADPTGRHVIGTLNNCAGGKTPWGTVLIAEENVNFYFRGTGPAEGSPEHANHARMGIPAQRGYDWHRWFDRFDVGKEPREANRFGWMVEVDPHDPSSRPVKRTALGRFKHEGATSIVNKDGRVVLYCGDDQEFEYLYRFVSRDKVDPDDPAANRNLLDHGTLYVARFTEKSVRWLPLVFGEGPLTESNGFRSQADVLIETRRAADLMGATPMDRPEDVEPNPVNGRVYVNLTNNKSRTADKLNPANPRGPNYFGQVLELVPPGGPGKSADHAADSFGWDFLLLAGNPADAASGAVYHPQSKVWFSSPDNCAIDRRGRLWIATDSGSAQAELGIPDGLYACDVDGKGRALVKFFYAVPAGAEMCGPEFTPDGTTLFVAVQHPGDTQGASFETPGTRWPDFKPGIPPRPSVVAITRANGKVIGG